MTRYPSDIQKLLDRRTNLRARDGAIVDPVVDETNGIQWIFKYRKNAPGKYKWFAYGLLAPLWANTGTVLTPTPISTPVQGAASIVLPFAGVYIPRLGAAMGGSGSGSSVVTWWWYVNGVTQLSAFQRQFTLGTLDTIFSEALIPSEVPIAGSNISLGMSVSVLGPVANGHTVLATPQRVNF